MPKARTLTPSASPMHFFGSEVRRAREAAGMSQTALGDLVPCDKGTISRIEAGLAAPDEAFALACDAAFPGMDGWFTRFIRDSAAWFESRAVPTWFEDWLQAEQQAHTLQIWSPLVIPGLLQTADYARALLLAEQTDTSDEAIDAIVAARGDRQGILDRPDPPDVTVVLDEGVLRRLIGSPDITHDALIHVANLALRPSIVVQVVPAMKGAHAGLGGAFDIASADTLPDVVRMDAVEDQTSDQRALVRKHKIAFNRVRGAATDRDASRDLIMKAAEEWKI